MDCPRRISHYSSDMDILLVGEGDFSFASALARAFQSAPRLIATSLDSREKLNENYGMLEMKIRLALLSSTNAEVMTEVDVKKIVNHPSLQHRAFDRIVYNFPHSGFVYGLTECDADLIRKHKNLMRSFFKNVRRLLKEGGEVHVAQHMSHPYSEWKLEEEAAKSGFKLRACHIFQKTDFPGYTPRRGAGNNAKGTFPLRKPATFIFFIPQSSRPPHHNNPSYPPLSSRRANSSSRRANSLSHPSMTHSCPSIISPLHRHPRAPVSAHPPHVPHSSNAISTPMSLYQVCSSSPTKTSPKDFLSVLSSPPPSPPIVVSSRHTDHQIINIHGDPDSAPSPFKPNSHQKCSAFFNSTDKAFKSISHHECSPLSNSEEKTECCSSLLAAIKEAIMQIIFGAAS